MMRCSLCNAMSDQAATGWVQVSASAGPAHRYLVICPDERMTLVSDELGEIIAGLRAVKPAQSLAPPTPRAPRPTPTKKGPRK